MGKHAQSIDRRVLERMTAAAKGSVFAPTDFLDLGTRTAVDQALSRNCRLGIIRKVARGLYDVPVQDPLLGTLSAQPDSIAQALVRRDGARLQVSGGAAAHNLGLTDQVPVRVVYLTDGPTRRIQVGKGGVVLRKAALRQMATAGRTSGTVIQALQWLGRSHVDTNTLRILRNRLSSADKQQLLQDLRFAPAWIAQIMKKTAEDRGTSAAAKLSAGWPRGMP